MTRPSPNAATAVPRLREAYRLMLRRFGHQHWWPGDSPFEVCVGAVLTQNTQWTNVARVIANLKAAGLLQPRKLLRLTPARLAAWIKSAGYPRVKARRLQAFLETLVRDHQGEVAQLLMGETQAVRHRLLEIHGIGPETADCMLLYAGGHLSFVVDAYTRRIFERHGWCRTGTGYGDLKARCEAALRTPSRKNTLKLWQDCHAQLVAVGKLHCRAREARCLGCPLECLLPRQPPEKLPILTHRRCGSKVGQASRTPRH